MKGSFSRFNSIKVVSAVLLSALALSLTVSTVNADTAPYSAVNLYTMGLLAGQNGLMQTTGPFQCDKIYSLKLAVTYNDLTDGVYIQEIRLYTPEGSLYQSISTPFTSRRARRGEIGTLSVREMARPLPIQVAAVTRNVTTVWAEAPVAGTFIPRMKGNWKAEAYLRPAKTSGVNLLDVAPPSAPSKTVNFTIQ